MPLRFSILDPPSSILDPLYLVLLAAEGRFPRGPGFYFSLVKLLLVVVVYLCWLRTCWWVEQDAAALKMPRSTWNPVMLGSGLAGLLAVWLLPWFLLSFPLLLLLYLAPTLVYVWLRNQRAAPKDRVLTLGHIERLLQRRPVLAVREDKRPPPMRFVPRGAAQRGEDPDWLARRQGVKLYRAALDLIHQAVRGRVTEIYLEAYPEGTAVQFGADGLLRPLPPLKGAAGDALPQLFKVVAGIDVAEKRRPQAGRFTVEVGDRPLDFRVATTGGGAGEKMVLQVRDPARRPVELNRLGMQKGLREQVHNLVTQPHGLFLICGPADSGKTSTLYACLNAIDRAGKTVVTIEEAVESRLGKVTQVEINPAAGKTFASELERVLRQMPDVLGIGELRDRETATLACRAARDGCMVLAAVQAAGPLAALVRLTEMGLDPALLAGSVSALLGQRLVRVLCRRCKVRYKPYPERVRKANLPLDKIDYFFKPRLATAPPNGADRKRKDEEVCPRCKGAGYFGRTGIFELVVINQRMRKLIRGGLDLRAIKQEAVKNGLVYLEEDALRQVLKGRTSIQEVLRVFD